MLLSQSRESCPSLLLLCTRNGTRLLPRRICAHTAQTLLSFGEHSVVEVSPDFQVAAQALGLACLNLQGQFEQERGRLLFGVLCAHLPHAFFDVERLFQS